jgi:hypothetical protein
LSDMPQVESSEEISHCGLMGNVTRCLS